MKFFWFNSDSRMGSIYDMDSSDGGCMAAIIGIFAGFWILAALLTIVIVAPFYIPVEGRDIINKFWNANKGLLIGIFSIALILKLFVKRLRNNRFVKVVLAIYVFVFIVYVLVFILGFDTIPLAVRTLVEDDISFVQYERVNKVIALWQSILEFSRDKCMARPMSIMASINNDLIGCYFREMQILLFLKEIGKYPLFVVTAILACVPIILAGALAFVISILPYVLGVYVAKNIDKLFQKLYARIGSVLIKD